MAARNRRIRPLDSSHDFRPGRAQRARTALLETFAPDSAYAASNELEAHISCVNSITLSNSGRWLASGGDDRVIYLWDVHGDLSALSPKTSFTGPTNLIYSVAFDCRDEKLYCTGGDGTIRQYDVATHLSHPITTVSAADSSSKRWRLEQNLIKKISPHPTDVSVFITASSDRTVRLYDCRDNKGCVGVIYDTNESVDCEFNPKKDVMFLTVSGVKDILLHDIRKSFRNGSTSTINASPQGLSLMKYNNTLAHGKSTKNRTPAPSSVCFDRDGNTFCAIVFNHSPVLYEIDDPNPLAVFSAEIHDGHRNMSMRPSQYGYFNVGTFKRGCFGGAHGADYFAVGSDDFQVYIWNIPSPDSLRRDRKILNYAQWHEHCSGDDVIVFGETPTGERCAPTEITKPCHVLAGHKSVVNDIKIHPSLPLMFTAGIERNIKAWVPAKMQDENKYQNDWTDLHAEDSDEDEEHSMLRRFDRMIWDNKQDKFWEDRVSSESDSSEDWGLDEIDETID